MIFKATDATTQHFAITWQAMTPDGLRIGLPSLDHNRQMGMKADEVAAFRRMVVEGASRREVGRWVLEVRQ